MSCYGCIFKGKYEDMGASCDTCKLQDYLPDAIKACDNSENCPHRVTLEEAKKKLLSSDVVEVVRCKDCKYSSLEWIGGDLEGICKCGSAMINITSNSYCSYGERSEKGETMSTLEKAVATYGKEMQLTVACEELSELIKEICKNIRGSDNVKSITKEMADCYIMLRQLEIIFGIKMSDINVFIDEKLARLEKRMAEREKAPGENREEVWRKNLERFKNGEFGECHTYEALAKYWKAQAEAGYPGANDSFNYFLSCVQERNGERQGVQQILARKGRKNHENKRSKRTKI